MQSALCDPARAVCQIFRYYIVVTSSNPARAAGATDTYRCKACGAEKPYTAEHFPSTRGEAVGTHCRPCSRARKRGLDKQARAKRAAARAAGPVSLTDMTKPAAAGKAVSTSRDALPGELPLRQLDVARALRVGAERLNEAAEGILSTILEYAGNTGSPHHEWALKLIAERVIPKKLYEDLGGQAAGIKAGQGTVRPAITVIVQQAAPASPDSLSAGARSPVVIDVTPERK